MRNLLEEREGWKRTLGEDEAPHSTFVERDRYRVVCRSCSWFFVRLGASGRDLRSMGTRHRQNMRGDDD